MLDKLCDAITAFEGWKVGYEVAGIRFGGSLGWRQRNPGDLRWSPFQSGAKNGFAVFPSDHAGRHALLYQLDLVARGKSPTYNAQAKAQGLPSGAYLTLSQFFAIFAPASDNNAPLRYSEYVAGRMGVHVTSTLHDLLEMG